MKLLNEGFYSGMFAKRKFTGIILIVFLLSFFGCGKNDVTEDSAGSDGFLSEATMEISSESLNLGRWNNSISNLDNGKNLSPQISFEPVNGAESYCIYMLDESAGNWVHWSACHITETELEEGASDSMSESSYVGPYPPKGSGDHKYSVYVFAMKDDPDTGYPDQFDEPFVDADKLYQDHLNKEGNVLEYGYIEGMFSTD